MYTSNTFLGLAALSMVASPFVLASYGQQQVLSNNGVYSLAKDSENSEDILTQHIVDMLEDGQFCGNSSTYALYWKGRPITFFDRNLYASPDNSTAPAAFTFTKTKNKAHTISHKNPWGLDFWWQDNSGQQYIATDKYQDVEFYLRVAKSPTNSKEEYMSIGRSGGRCLRFNGEGYAYMSTNSACDPVQFMQVDRWNSTWMDPLEWKNCVADVLKEEFKDEVEAARDSMLALKQIACRAACSLVRDGHTCQECKDKGHY